MTKFKASDGSNLGTYPVGSYPTAIAFDGTNIWVMNYFSSNVTKLRASDGQLAGTYNVVPGTGMAFDGTKMWITNAPLDLAINTVTAVNLSDGSVIATYPAGNHPGAICFDGANIWVGNGNVNTVTKF